VTSWRNKLGLQPNNNHITANLGEDQELKGQISFVTTCMGRTHHLKQTIKINLPLIQKFNCQMVLVNWNSQDGLDELIIDKYSKYIKNGTLKYFHTTEPKYFHMSKAKNLAHTLGDNKYLYNLDADEFLSVEEMERLNIIDFDLHRNTRGRIMIKKELFYSMLGYREDFIGWGYEDDDLINRFKNSGLVVLEKNYNPLGINHDTKLENTRFKGRRHNTLRKNNKEISRMAYTVKPWNIKGKLNGVYSSIDVWHKFIFIHNPKTAGLSIRKVLQKYPEKILVTKRKRHFVTKGTNQIVFVRHPLERFKSAYNYILNGEHKNEKLRSHIKNNYNNFDHFSTDFNTDKVVLEDDVFKHQINWAKNCKFILRYENIVYEWNKICMILNINEKLPVINKNKNNLTFSKNGEKNVRLFYECDFCEFNYD